MRITSSLTFDPRKMSVEVKKRRWGKARPREDVTVINKDDLEETLHKLAEEVEERRKCLDVQLTTMTSAGFSSTVDLAKQVMKMESLACELSAAKEQLENERERRRLLDVELSEVVETGSARAGALAGASDVAAEESEKRRRSERMVSELKVELRDMIEHEREMNED